MADDLKVLLSILLDKAAQQGVERGLSDIEKKLEGLDNVKFDGENLDALNKRLYLVESAMKGINDKYEDQKKQVAELTRASTSLQQVFQPLAVAGTALVAGIALQARSYVKFVEKAGIQGDDTAKRWIAATAKVKNAQLNLGEEAARAILPIYEKAAELATKAAAFVDRNPDLVRAALNTGLVVATLGAVGTAVAKGIKIYADLKYLAATAEFENAIRIFQTSVHKLLSGSVLGGGGGGLGGVGKIGTVLSIATLAVGEIVLATTATNALLDYAGAPRLQEMAKAEGDFIKGLKDVFSGDIKLNDLAAQVVGVAQASADARKSVDDLSGSINNLGDSSGLRDFQKEANLAQATQAFISYRKEETQAEQRYSAQRASIVSQGLQEINQIEANYQKQRSNLVAEYQKSRATAIASFEFQQAQAEQQFAQQEAQAVQQFNQSRAESQKEYRTEERRRQQDHQRELRKLAEEHNDRVRDLTAARDALGLVREQRDYQRKVRDANEEYSVESKRRKQDFQRKLQEQAQQFAQEQARRRQEFEFRQKQAEEQFAFQQAQAAAQFEERLKQLAEQHRLELEQSRRQTQERLRDLQLQYRQEQVTRRNAFYDILRDLDASLLNEENLRLQYYQRMQDDLLRFLETTSNQIGGAGSNLPGYQHGGYTPGGAIRTHPGEYVLDPQSTKAMEQLVGGRLTRQSIKSLTNNQATTVQLAFPGGLITRKVLDDALDANTARLLKQLTRGLA